MSLQRRIVPFQIGCLLLAMQFATGYAQETSPLPAPGAVDAPVISSPGRLTMFPLRFIDVNEAKNVVQQLVGAETRIVSEERTNSLLVMYSEDQVRKTVEGVLEQIDRQAAPSDSGHRLQWLPVRLNESADSESMKTLFKSMGEQADGRNIVKSVLWESDHGGLLVLGSDAEFRNLQRTIEELNEIILVETSKRHDQEKALQGPVILRVVWLMSGLEERMTRPAPDNVQKAADKLQALGVGPLRQLTQILVRVGEGQSQSQQSGMVSAPKSVTFDVSATHAGGSNWQLQVRTVDGEEGQFSTSTTAEVTLRPGQVIILGVGPCGGHDSAFAVEIVPQE